MNARLEDALSHAAFGLYVFPCKPYDHPTGPKAPYTNHGLNEATVDPSVIRSWWEQWPDALVGINCGRSGLVVVDLDVKDGHDGPDDWQRHLDGRKVPSTFKVQTPSGGWHGWYRDGGVRYKSHAGLLGRGDPAKPSGVDIRAIGGYVIAPGQAGYTWHAEQPMSLDDIPVLPREILPETSSEGGAGPWRQIEPEKMHPADLAALEALQKLGGHSAYLSDQHVKITRPGKIAGTGATIGYLAPGTARVWTSNWPPLEERLYDADELRKIAGFSEPEPETPEDVEAAEMAAAAAFATEVEREAHRLRVRDSALRKVSRERSGDPAEIRSIPLDEFLAQPDPEAAFRVDRMWPIGGRVVLAAQYKAGKTTLVGNLVRSLADGVLFLDEFAVEAVDKLVLIDDELDERTLRRWLREQGIQNVAAIEVIPLRGKLASFDLLDPETCAEWAAKVQGADVVMLDCLRPILDALGLSEDKDAGRFLVAFDSLLARAGIGDGLVVHHMGHSGERSRGDSRILDWPDATWKLVRHSSTEDGGEPDLEGPRYLSAYGRDVALGESRLEYEPLSRRLTLKGGTRKEAAVELLIPNVVEYVTHNPGCSQADLEDGIEGRAKTIRDAAGKADERGFINRRKVNGRWTHTPGRPVVPPRPGRADDPSSPRPYRDEDEVGAIRDPQLVPDEPRCRVCNLPIHPKLAAIGETTHPACEEPA